MGLGFCFFTFVFYCLLYWEVLYEFPRRWPGWRSTAGPTLQGKMGGKSLTIFGASNHLRESSKHHFRTQDSKMLQNDLSNAWKMLAQESRRSRAGAWRAGSLASRGHGPAKESHNPSSRRKDGNLMRLTRNQAVNRQPGSRPRDLWSRYSVRGNMYL